MNLKELQKEIEVDLKLTPNGLENKLYEVPMLHSKYLGKYIKAKKTYDDLELELDSLYKEKWHYYTKESDDLLTQSKVITLYVEGDKNIINARRRLNSAGRILEYLKRTLDKITFLGGDCKNIIEWVKHLQGTK